MVGAVAWFAGGGRGARGLRLLGGIAGPTGLLPTAGGLRYVARPAGLPADARRFWNGIATVALLCGIGVAVQGYQTRFGGPKLPTAAALVFLAAMLGAVWTLVRVPVRPRTAAGWVRLSLDAATVVLGAA